MLSARPTNKYFKKRTKNMSIQHKITTTLFILLLLYLTGMFLLNKIFFTITGKVVLIPLLGIAVLAAFLLAKSTARLLSIKFVEQVNKITDTAKLIANSRDLSKRLEKSGSPDELYKLEDALNGMLDQLEEAFETQKRFSADASHEIRTPIAVLNGYLDVIKKWGKNDPDLLEESINAMKEETTNLKKLSENLLLLSRLELDQHSLEWETIELDLLIEKLIKDTLMISNNRTVQSLQHEPLKIKGDYSLLLQMLRGVIENSIKYTEEDGEISINYFTEGNWAIIQISDNGKGIPEKDLQRIFERFYRVDKGRDRAKGGTGLGLALTKYIVQIHGGKVEAKSKVGQGTTMVFRLPLE